MLFKEKEGGDDDIRLRHRRLGAVQRAGGGGPIGRRVHFDADAGHVFGQTLRHSRGGAGGVGVEGNQDDAVGYADAAIAHNAPSLRRGSRR